MVSLLITTLAMPGRANALINQSLPNDNGFRPAWGLDQIDQRTSTLDDVYRYEYTGQGVKVYVLDSGINSTHQEFGDRVASGFSAIDDSSTTEDCNGHGTHVAGVIGGATYGVAKQVTLVPVRVLNCSASGSTTDVLEGINWMIANHQPGELAVANMSIGGASTNSAFDAAVRDALAVGIHVVIAAGNRNANACNYSPSRVTEAIIVGAVDRDLSRTFNSNFGSCIDVWAPGSDIVAAWWDSSSTYRSRSGTSIAAPHTAGVVALLLQELGAMSTSAMSNLITSNTTSNLLTDLGTDSPNLLLHSLSASVQSSLTSTTAVSTSTSSTTTTTASPTTTSTEPTTTVPSITSTTTSTPTTTSSSISTSSIPITSSTTTTTSLPLTLSSGGSSSSSSKTTTTTSTTTSTTSTTVAVLPMPAAKSGISQVRKCRSGSTRVIRRTTFRCNAQGLWVQTKRQSTNAKGNG